jgi:hypothetical protein
VFRVLIVAIPKSASTALVATLSEAHSIPIRTREIRDDVLLRRPIAPGYWHAAQFHRRDFVEVDERVAAALAAPGMLAKFHLPPTPRNQALLRRIPKIVLLRDAEEVVSAYHRGERTGAWPAKSYEFAFCFSEPGWRAHARRTGLTSELRDFADGWRAHDGDKLVLEASELVADPARALARVENYLGLRSAGPLALRHERYSRHSTRELGLPRMLWRRRGLFAKRLLAEASRLVTGSTARADRFLENRRRSRTAAEPTERAH